MMRRLTDAGLLTYATADAGDVVATAGECRVMIESVEDVVILAEVFLNGLYNLRLPFRCAVMDIGMNVGMASLFRAQQESVLTVVGYEPFEPTFRQAERNLKLNPLLSGKITPVNVGLGYSDRRMTVPYFYDRKGSASLHRAYVGTRGDSATQQPVSIRDVAVAVAELRARVGTMPLVVKMDCEGSEYEIVRRLHDSGDLSRIAAMIIEWHDEGPAQLLTAMAAHGFGTVALRPTNGNEGMIYATRLDRSDS
jgi:FkbM family methyltransferase